MRHIYPTLFLLCIASLIRPVASAQCTIFNPAIKLNHTSTNGIASTCEINLDLYFDLQSNAGGKYVYVHIWPKALYPSLVYNNPPDLTQLVNSVATLGFYHFGGQLYLLNSYTPYPTVPNFKYTGLTIIKSAGTVNGSDRFTIQNITITGSAGCGVAQDFAADVWESQSASAQNVHCFSKGLKFYANDPKAQGSMLCGPPRQYQFQITTIDPAGLTVDYKVYIDDGDGIFNSTTDNVQIAAGMGIELNSGNGFMYQSPVMDYLPYSNQKPEADRALWIVVSSASRDNESYARVDNNCESLPMVFGNFMVRLKDQRAQLEWSTLTEIDNQGFDIERKDRDDPRPFRPIGYVTSLATQGNSSDELVYRFIDPDPIGSTTLYRIKQIDRSGKISYSPIRSVSMRDLMTRMLPNPADEQVNLIFTDKQTIYQVELINDAGQRMGSWNASDRLTITTRTLPSGTHRLRIIDTGTGRSETRTILIRHMQ